VMQSFGRFIRGIRSPARSGAMGMGFTSYDMLSIAMLAVESGDHIVGFGVGAGW
jgi:hypothetical protein